MAGTNSFIFFVLTWISIREHYLEEEWQFRLAFCAVLVAFAIYAELAGPKRNYLFQIFAAKAVVMFTLALQAYLSREWLLVAIALEGLGLCFSYRRAGLVIFKLMGLGLMLITFVGCLLSVRFPGEVDLLGFTVPARWFTCVSVPIVFAIIAWFNEHFIRPIPAAERVAKGQWFLADTFLDISSATNALLHAMAATLILIAITVIDLGGEVYLPYLLAGESVLGILFGLALRTPQVQIASVLLLASAHVSYYVFLFVGKTGFEAQLNYVPYTVAVAGFTFVGGFVWERYLGRIQGGGRWEHDGLVSIPYLAATLLLTTLMTGILPAPYVPVGQNALGIVLLCLGALSGLAGLRISGILALAVGTATFYSGLFTFGSPLSEDPNFFPILLLVLSSYIAAERLLTLTIKSDPAVSRINRILCILLVGVVGLLGGLGLWEWAPQERLTFFWLGLAVGMMVLGALFRESRYRWASLAVYFVVIVRAYAYDLTNLSPLVQFISFTALCLPLLIMSWAYSQYRIRHLGKLKSRHEGGTTSDG